MLITAQMIARAALRREESRGGHYRLDFPIRNDNNWLKNIVVRKDDGEMKLNTKQVVMARFRPDELLSDSPLALALEGIERLNIEKVRGKMQHAKNKN